MDFLTVVWEELIVIQMKKLYNQNIWAVGSTDILSLLW